MIQIKQRKKYDTDRCSACFDNVATVIINFGTEDSKRPGTFDGGYRSLGLCRDCAGQLKSSLECCATQECAPPCGEKEDCELNKNGLCNCKSH